jgi:hypothetical protein
MIKIQHVLALLVATMVALAITGLPAASAPGGTPGKPTARPSKSPKPTPSVTVSPSATPTEPSVTPTEPSVTPTEPSVTPIEPSVTPTETTPPPSPAVCTDPVYRSSANGAMYNDGDYIVHNNLWNISNYSGVSSTIEACSYKSWNVITTANNNTGDGAVKTYPNVHKDYHNWSTGYEPPLSNYPVLRSTFAADGPDSGIYNIAYDIWLNGVPGNREVMIWTDNQGQRPAGSLIASSLNLGGHSWNLWATGDNHILTYVAVTDMTSGTVDLRAHLNDLITRGRVPATSTLGQICFGVEVVSTGGVPMTFNFTDFSLTDTQ